MCGIIKCWGTPYKFWYAAWNFMVSIRLFDVHTLHTHTYELYYRMWQSCGSCLVTCACLFPLNFYSFYSYRINHHPKKEYCAKKMHAIANERANVSCVMWCWVPKPKKKRNLCKSTLITMQIGAKGDKRRHSEANGANRGRKEGTWRDMVKHDQK